MKTQNDHSSNQDTANVISTEVPTPVSHEFNDADQFQLIQARAYALWEEAGRPDGENMKEQFWCEAENRILSPQPGDRCFPA